ncbi:tRNA (adenosine(37)-N6)-threonylcarbamoyltransferase complex ATPase subunit type 1 TsaE [Candidatus Latescibacterota bacterium]
MIEKFETKDEAGTLEIAYSFGKTLTPGTVIALNGELGAGKTVFTRGVAKAFKVAEKVTSPTFTLINEYKGEIPIYHMDFYRLNSIKEILDIGVEDYFYGDGICLVEWAEKMGDNFPEEAVTIVIKHSKNNNRDIIIER